MYSPGFSKSNTSLLSIKNFQTIRSRSQPFTCLVKPFSGITGCIPLNNYHRGSSPKKQNFILDPHLSWIIKPNYSNSNNVPQSPPTSREFECLSTTVITLPTTSLLNYFLSGLRDDIQLMLYILCPSHSIMPSRWAGSWRTSAMLLKLHNVSFHLAHLFPPFHRLQIFHKLTHHPSYHPSLLKG